MRISDWSSDVCSSDLPAMNAHHAAPADFIATEHRLGAHNYKPLDVILTRGEGVWLWDVDGNRYMDCLYAYSAVNQGHCHPKILEAMVRQAGLHTVTSRAFRNDQIARLSKELAGMTGNN